LPKTRLRSWLQSFLLAAPLVVIAGWVAIGGINRSHAPTPPNPPASAAPASFIPGLPPPEMDLASGRLEERVDGAAEFLRAQGCRRLIAFRLADPPADLEILVFRNTLGAASVLARDAGPERTPGPGEEAALTAQSALFRRGAIYVRLLGAPERLGDADRLVAVASRVDEFLKSDRGARL
jgi:hypothetical protein